MVVGSTNANFGGNPSRDLPQPTILFFQRTIFRTSSSSLLLERTARRAFGEPSKATHFVMLLSTSAVYKLVRDLLLKVVGYLCGIFSMLCALRVVDQMKSN